MLRCYLFPLFGFLTLLSACGNDYTTEKIKSYRLALALDDADLRAEFRSLIRDFNRYARLPVLEYVEQVSEANSAIVVTEGLQSRDGKVGWGQWMTETRAESPFIHLPGNKPRKSVFYAMRIEFDADYMRRNDQYGKQKLFFHEVGHGLEMDHIQKDSRDIMYPDVVGEKDFESYFERVRVYFSDRHID